MIEPKFRALMGNQSALVYLEPLKAAMALHAIDTEKRISHFLAQVAHESGGFTRITEIQPKVLQPHGRAGFAVTMASPMNSLKCCTESLN